MATEPSAPPARLPLTKRPALGAFAALSVLTVVLVALLLPGTDQGVVTGRGGIVALELAGSVEAATSLVGDGRTPITPAEASVIIKALWLDVVLILVYTGGLVAAVVLLVPLFRLRSLRRAWRAVGFAAAAPGVLDVVENVLIATALTRDRPVDGWFLAASVSAFTKFVLLTVFVVFIISALLVAVSTPDWLHRRLDTDNPGQPVKLRQQGGLGIAFSGGGVRAASLSLGALQELERGSDLGWGSASRVTSVSGGSYMAGAWQIARNGPHADPQAWSAGAGGPGPEERHLLDNLGYLAATWPRGRPDDVGAPTTLVAEEADPVARRMRASASVWATIFTGLVVNVVAIAVILVLAVIPIGMALGWLARNGPGPDVTPLELAAQPRMIAPAVAWLTLGLVAAMVWVVAGKVPFLRSARLLTALKVLVRSSLVLGVSLGLLLVGFPLLVALVEAATLASVTAAAGAVVGVAAAIVRTVRRLAPGRAAQLGGLAFALLLVVGTAFVAKAVWLDLDPWWGPRIWSAALAVTFLGWLLFSPELWSMFAFYRGKLRSAYALHRVGSVAVPYVNDADVDKAAGHLEEPELGKITSNLTICAAAHATTRGVRTHYGIPAMSFTFDHQQVRMFVPEDDLGGSRVYPCTVEQLRVAYQGAGLPFTTRRLTTMFAVALSGAAVAPAMGRFRIGPTSMLITFANLRLGGWLPNPRYVAPPGAEVRRFPMVRLGYLFKEFLGLHDPADPFVYVSDGGHWENTGLVELLREQLPREVIMVDADAGSAQTIRQLAQAIDLAKLECAADIGVNLEPLRCFADAEGAPLFAERSVTLGAISRAGTWSLLWYTKPVLTRSSPTSLLSHREVDAQFPMTSTVDQFFDTSTYAAYRDLGRYNAAEIKIARGRLAEALRDRGTVQAWLSADLDQAHWVERTFADLLRQLDGDGSPSRQQQFFEHASTLLVPSTPVAP